MEMQISISNLVNKFYSAFEESYKKQIRSIYSIDTILSTIADLSSLDKLLGSESKNYIDQKSFNDFIIQCNPDLKWFKNELIEYYTDTLIDISVLREKINICKNFACNKAGIISLKKFIEVVNSFENRKLLPLIREAIHNWNDNYENDNNILIHTFSGNWNYFLTPECLLYTIKEAGLIIQLKSELIQIFINPVEVITNENSVLFLSTKCSLIFLSEILIKIEAIENFSTVKIYVPGTIIFDTDVSNKIYSGKNFIIICETIDMEYGDKIIDLSGVPGLNADGPEKAADGNALEEIEDHGKKFKTGGRGSNGNSGKNATISGDILIACVKISGNGKLTIKANGANGGNGQDGGDGQKLINHEIPGCDPHYFYSKDVDPVSDANIKSLRVRLFEELAEEYYLFVAPKGNMGIRGGNGGNGGNSGMGSESGNILLLGDIGKSNIIKQNVNGSHGQVGKNGKGSDGSFGGIGGRIGLGKDVIEESMWGEGAGVTVHENVFPDRSEFDTVWNVFKSFSVKISDPRYKQMLLSKRGESGDKGAIGKDGESGKIDGQFQTPPLLKNSHSLKFYHILSSFLCSYCMKDPSTIDFILNRTGIFSPHTFDPDFLYELFKEIEILELSFDNPEQETSYFLSAKKIYEKSQLTIISMTSTDNLDWKFLQFFIDQKLRYYNERLTGGSYNGNRVVNLQNLTSHIETVLKESVSLSKEEKKERSFHDFTDHLNSCIASGLLQVAIVKDKINKLCNDSSDVIADLLDEISHLKQTEILYKEDLEKKKAQLQIEMKLKLSFSIVKSVIKIVETIAESGSVCSSTLQSIESKFEDNFTNISIQELQNKARQDQALIKAAKETKLQFQIPDHSLDTSESLHKKAFDSFSPDFLKKYSDMDETQIRSFIGQYDTLEDQKSQLYKKLHEKDDLSYQEYATFEKEKEEIDKKIDSLINKNDKLADAVFSYKKAEIDELKKADDKKTDEAKIVAYQQTLKEKEDYYFKNQLVQTIKDAVNIGTEVYHAIDDFVTIKKSCNGQLSELGSAILNSELKIGSLIKMDEDLRCYQKDFLEKKMLKKISDAQENFGKSNEFELVLSKQDIENFINIQLKKIKEEFSEIKTSSELIELMQDIENLLNSQIIIFDKIQNRNSQREMGELIYDLTSSNLSWSANQLQLLKFSKILHVKNLIHLQSNAYLLWTFPFGSQALAGMLLKVSQTDNPEEINKLALIQNNIIRDWLTEDMSFLTAAKYTVLYKNFDDHNPYATVSFADNKNQACAFLTGEEISLSLPPSEDYNLVKYISLYAFIPLYQEIMGQSLTFEPGKITITMTFQGPTSFLFFNTANTTKTIYQFNQDPFSITHSMDVKIRDEEGVGAIWTSTEDEVILKFKKNEMHSGRSPYSKIKIKINKHLWNKTFDISEISECMKRKFEIFFPNHKYSAKIKLILSDIKNAGWISSENNIARWSDICNSNELDMNNYTNFQIQWIKDILFEQSNIFKISDVTDFHIKFVGYGIYAKDQDDFTIPQVYNRFIEKK
jgi:hypothetical protein